MLSKEVLPLAAPGLAPQGTPINLSCRKLVLVQKAVSYEV